MKRVALMLLTLAAFGWKSSAEFSSDGFRAPNPSTDAESLFSVSPSADARQDVSASGTLATPPSIISISPNSGPIGSTVTIAGTNFNATAANNIVYFGAVKATVTSATTTSLTVSVPLGTTYALVSVTDVTTHLTAYSTQPFTVTYQSSRAIDASSFPSRVGLGTGTYPKGIAIADMDGDGKPDIVVANGSYAPLGAGSNNVSVFRNLATSGSLTASSFATSLDLPAGIGAWDVAVGDLDGDGKLDIAVTNENTANTVTLYRNTSTSGSLSFAARQDIVTGPGPAAVKIIDVDGDGKPELLVTCTGTTGWISIYRNTSTSGSISFGPNVDFATGVNPQSIAFADIDGDGKSDLVVSCGGNTNNVGVFRNTSSSGVFSFDTRVDFTPGSGPFMMAVTDVDGDGKLDIVALNSYSNTISVFRNTSLIGKINSSSFSAKVDFATGSYPYGLAATDLDGDGKPDVVVVNASSNTISVFHNTSTLGSITSGSFAPKIDISTDSYPAEIAIGDLDGDGKPDLAVTNNTSNTISVYRNAVTTVGFTGPIVTTQGATSIATTSATLNGNVNPNGALSTAWFEWGTSGNLTTSTATPTQSIGKGTSAVAVNTVLTGLSSLSTYYYRVVGRDSSGPVRGSIMSFKTVGVPPTVVTNPPTSVGATSATLSGIINANGDSTTIWFEWGTDPNMTTFSSTPQQSIGSGTSITVVTAKIAILPNTTYRFRAVAQNSGGTVRGSVFNFTSTDIVAGEYSSDASTVLLFHLDETSGSAAGDASSYGNNGTATGTTIVDGRFAKARSFNGSTDIINVPDNNAFSFGTGPFAVEAWVKFNAAPSRMAIVGHDEGATALYNKWIFWYENGAIKFHINNLVSGLVDLVAVPWTPLVGKWYHLAVLHSGSTFDLYMDGLRVATQTSTVAIPTVQASLTIGSAEGVAFLNGAIDEVRLSNKARLPQEFNLQLPPTNVSASVSATTASLSWLKGGGAVGLLRFKIYRGTDSTNVSVLDSTAAVQYADAGLTSGKTYFYRVSAVDSTGFESARGYSAIAPVGVANSSPTVTTTASTSPGLTTVTLNGSVNPNGLLTNVWFEWGTSSTLSTSSATATVSAGSGNSQVPVSTGLTGLSSGTTYYYRLVGQNSAGKTLGSILSFTTTSVPTVATSSATSVTSASATIGGSVNPNGITTTAWFEWGVSSTLTSYSSTSAISLGSGASAIPVTANLTGLTLNTTYYFRVVGQNSAGTQRGSILSFTTTAQLPITSTRLATVPKPGSALLSGNVNPNGLTTTASFEWGTSSTLSTSISAGTQQVGAGTSDVLVTVQIDLLTPNTTYYFRVVGQNAAGTSKGSIVSFLSTPGQPSLSSPSNSSSSQPASVLLSWSSVSGATSYHVQLSTNSSFNAPILLNDSTVSSSSRLVSNLALSSSYSWRVRAKNSSGYGDWSTNFSFSTATTKTVTSPGISYPSNPTNSTDYRLVSIPGTSLPSFGQILTGTQKNDWRIFEENGGTVPSNINELSAQSTPDAGQGYWLLTKGTFNFSRSVTMPQLDADGTTPVSVLPSWNIIGNPFDVPVNWATVQADNQMSSTLWSYEGTGGFRSSTTLDPFRGYYFFNTGAGILKIRYPFPSLVIAPVTPLPIAWRLQLSLETEQGTDTENYIGIASLDAKNVVSLSQPKPPGLFDQYGLCLMKSTQGGQVQSMSSDIRSEVGDGQVWDFEISNPRLTKSKIHIVGVEGVPPMYSIVLIDEHNSVPRDLRRNALVEFRMSSDRMRFHLVVGKEEFVEEQVSKFIPGAFGLCQNYPNPFNPSTSITYDVPRNAFVKVEVISVLGQHVQTLAEGIHSPGTYTVVWNAGGSHVNQASSGVYFARLLVDGTVVNIKKMMLLK